MIIHRIAASVRERQFEIWRPKWDSDELIKFSQWKQGETRESEGPKADRAELQLCQLVWQLPKTNCWPFNGPERKERIPASPKPQTPNPSTNPSETKRIPNETGGRQCKASHATAQHLHLLAWQIPRSCYHINFCIFGFALLLFSSPLTVSRRASGTAGGERRAASGERRAARMTQAGSFYWSLGRDSRSWGRSGSRYLRILEYQKNIQN